MHSAGPLAERITLRTIRKMVARGRRFACLTCYDATTARWMERAGLPMLLVGDTLAETILGFDQTIFATMDVMVALTAAVRRGAPHALVMADMPFMSYQAEDAEALRNAARFMAEAGADLVKLEADRTLAPLVEKMARAGVPVVAHVGSRPQHAKLTGGYRSVGRTPREAMEVVADARALEAAGAAMLLVEAVPPEVSESIVTGARVPVIGCGAGPACHGQVIVLHDLLGLSDWQPKFAQPVADFGPRLVEAVKAWIDKVDRNDLGEHPYAMVAEDDARDASPPGVAGANGTAAPKSADAPTMRRLPPSTTAARS